MRYLPIFMTDSDEPYNECGAFDTEAALADFLNHDAVHECVTIVVYKNGTRLGTIDNPRQWLAEHNAAAEADKRHDRSTREPT